MSIAVHRKRGRPITLKPLSIPTTPALAIPLTTIFSFHGNQECIEPWHFSIVD